MLRSYLEEINASPAILKYASDEADEDMMPRSLQLSLIDMVIEYTIKLFGDYPSRDQKIMMARAIIIVFPTLKFKESQIGGYVCFYIKTNFAFFLNTRITKICKQFYFLGLSVPSQDRRNDRAAIKILSKNVEQNQKCCSRDSKPSERGENRRKRCE